MNEGRRAEQIFSANSSYRPVTEHLTQGQLDRTGQVELFDDLLRKCPRVVQIWTGACLDKLFEIEEVFEFVKNLMKATLGIAVLLFAGTAFGQVSIGIQIGAPPPARVVKVRPKAPGPEYTWVDGYWYAVGKKYVWHEGYWTRPPYEGARWVPPRHDGKMYYGGYWEGEKGRVEHDHKFDKDQDRDFRRSR